jgi:exodeoxyribonuclease V gamma subunit
MLTVHHSNRLELLADHLTERRRQPCGGPLLPETVSVQSTGHLAQHLGICAQIWFPFPAAFVWELCRRLLPNVPETPPFAPDVLAWRIMTLLETLEESPRFAPLQAYCADKRDSPRLARAVRIAALFEQYLVYRPDWIIQWERGEDEHWQAELWRRLATSAVAHRVRLHDQLVAVLQAKHLACVGLPARVSLIGIPTMPPLYLGQGHPGGALHERRDGLADGARLGFHIRVQQGVRRARQRHPHHGRGNIQGVPPVLLRLSEPRRRRCHHGGVRRQALTVQGRL